MNVSLLPSGMARSAGTVGATRPAPLGPGGPVPGSLGPVVAGFAQPAIHRTIAIVRARIGTPFLPPLYEARGAASSRRARSAARSRHGDRRVRGYGEPRGISGNSRI